MSVAYASGSFSLRESTPPTDIAYVRRWYIQKTLVFSRSHSIPAELRVVARDHFGDETARRRDSQSERELGPPRNGLAFVRTVTGASSPHSPAGTGIASVAHPNNEFAPEIDVERTIGIDVCQKFLDAEARPAMQRKRFNNDPDGIAELLEWARTHDPERIVLESTGTYQKAALGALLAGGLPAVLVNPRQVRDFAKGLGLLAKTDVLDAGVLARFGQIVPTVVRTLPEPEIQEFREIYDRRGQLVRMLANEKNHRHATTSKAALRDIEAHIRHLEKRIADLEKRMNRFVEQTDAYRERDAILQSIPGVGPQVSRTLLAHLPELGEGSREQIAALAGLAPYADDSGQERNARHIRGGRSAVRLGLYQAAVVAISHCAPMKAMYKRLLGRGKAKKVALVAVARKLLVLAHALIRDMKPFDPQKSANSVCPETP
ncbi:MAG: IS110 family transposase [Planctomycetia bacterium]